MPQEDAIHRKQSSKGFSVFVANWPLINESPKRSNQQPRKRNRARIVQSDDDLRASQRNIDPFAVSRIDNPGISFTDRSDAPSLLVIRDGCPIRLIRQVIDGMPREAGLGAELRRKRSLARASHAVDQNPGQLRSSRITHKRRHARQPSRRLWLDGQSDDCARLKHGLAGPVWFNRFNRFAPRPRDG
jgi:hypothetical protein